MGYFSPSLSTQNSEHNVREGIYIPKERGEFNKHEWWSSKTLWVIYAKIVFKVVWWELPEWEQIEKEK